jgi:SAM-dependent methyltransferase
MSLAAINNGLGNLQMEAVDACPACSSKNSSGLYKAQDWLYGLPGEFELSRCNDCQAIYLSKRPTAESIGFYYPGDAYYSYKRPVSYSLFWREDVISSAWYFIKKSILAHQYGYKHMGGSKLVSIMARAPMMGPLRKRATFELDVLLHPYIDNGSLLEVGCGSGGYLDLMRALGWKRVVGVDIGDEAIRQVKEGEGIEAYCGDLRDMRFEPDSFDAVSLSHTLEHVYDPVEFLCEVRRILKPGGRLAIVVPNLESLSSRRFGEYWFHLDAPRHTVNYTRRGLSTLIEQAGFTTQKLTTTPRGAYQTAIYSYSRKTGDDRSIYTDNKHRFSMHRRMRAFLLSLIEHIRCAAGLPSGEELVAVGIKPH